MNVNIKINKQMKAITVILSTTIIILGTSCKKKDPLNDTDRNFLTMASYGNYNEIDAGQLAATKATDTLVKNFGNRMITDHQIAKNELISLAQNKEVTLPTGPDQTHITMKQQLMNMSGRTFDSTYIPPFVNKI
jgi:putative membrane protein